MCYDMCEVQNTNTNTNTKTHFNINNNSEAEKLHATAAAPGDFFQNLK